MPAADARAVRGLAILAGILGVAAAFAGSAHPARRGVIDVNALARTVEHEDDHVTAVELAEWIIDRHAGLRVVDVRSPSEFDAYHVPTAERIPLEELSTSSLRPTETIVLYSEGGAHAAQGWVFLRALGFEHVYFLRGGVLDWLEDVMNPTLAANAPANDSAAFGRASALSRYFGGVPRAGVEAQKTNAATLVARTRRRGC
jgi:rhodanese-related sulfurtransferase